MTEDHFFELLAETNKWVNWTSTARGWIGRAYFCPITAVVFINRGALFQINQVQQAAEYLGLEPGLANNIARAADFGEDTDTQQFAKRLKETIHVSKSNLV